MNVFATPGEVFEEVKASRPCTANWLVPVLLACLVGVIYTSVIFSQETVLRQVREAREKAVRKQLESKKVPKEQMEQAIAMAEKFSSPTLLKILGSAGAAAGSFGWLFFLALMIWLLGRYVLKADFPYLKAAEVCGLAGMIGVVGGIISMLLVVVTGNMFVTPGPALLLREFDPANKTHLLLAMLNVMTIWYIGVLAIGLSRLSGASVSRSALLLVVPWVSFRVALIFSGLGGQGM